jgi:glycerol uptake facilitator-like aquaporin
MTPGEISPVSGEIVLNKDQAVSRVEAVTPMTTEAGSMPSLAQRLFSEWLGTAFLLAAVVGSGIMAAKLAGGNGVVALLCNTLATGAIWVVLILVFGSTSGAHFNPAVSLAFALRGALPWRDAALYIVAQLVGGTVGVWAAHGMFELPLWQFSGMARTGTGQRLAETIATFGLILTIFGCLARTPSAISFAVGLYVTSASWFTASGSFANPAVTIARSMSDTFAGIAPAGVLAFIIAQIAGMLLAVAVAVWLWPNQQVWGRTCTDRRRSSDGELR